MNKSVLKIGAAVLSMGLMAGCATSNEAVERAQATADQALAAANSASSTASAAQSAADRAMQLANSASSQAGQALSAANAAQASADANRERLERMFQKSMSK